MSFAIQSLSTLGYDSASLQARIEALRATQRGTDAATARAAEASGAQAAQSIFARTPDIVDIRSTTAQEDIVNGRSASNLRGNVVSDFTELQEAVDPSQGFTLGTTHKRPQQTLADLKNPQLNLDSAAFVNLFAQARPSLSLTTNNAQSIPFQRATASLSSTYALGEDLAIDFAA